MEKIMSNPIAWCILAVCTIASFFYAVITRRKDKKKKQFVYIKKSNYIVSNKKKLIEKLSLTFDGKEIDDLTVSTFAIWNSQNKEIRREDIATDCQLRIRSTGKTKILDAKILIENEPTNNFAIVEVSEKEVVFDFEYADKKEGIVVQIIHTGESGDLHIECKIKGGAPVVSIKKNGDSLAELARTIVQHTNDKVMVSLTLALGIFETALLVFLVLLSFGAFSETIIQENSTHEFPVWGKIIICIFVGLSAVFIWASCIHTIRRILNSRVPNEFRDYV